MRLTIEKLVHGGHGIGSVDGRRVFVPYSAPGDVLEVELVVDHGSYIEARIVSVVTPAQTRVTPRCPVYGECGGCQWQHLAYDAQLLFKRDILIETLERIGKIESPNVLSAMPSPKQWNYRNRIQLHVDSAGRVGFYKQRSKDVVEFEQCHIADERVNQELSLRREEFRSRDRGVALRAEGPEGFGQVNSIQNKCLAGLLCSWLSEQEHNTVLELYAGSGNFTFDIARVAAGVIASDIDGRAIREAQLKLEDERAMNVQFACMPADRAARRFGKGCDAVIVDPPRKGCSEAVEAIVESAPSTVLYISCDPATLARDARSFIDRGYNLVRTQPVDMFPQTFHVESLSLFKKKSA